MWQCIDVISHYVQVYISCSVILCEAGNNNTRCAKGCVTSNQQHHRRKREAVMETGVHFISQGPLRLRSTPASGSRGNVETLHLWLYIANNNIIFKTSTYDFLKYLVFIYSSNRSESEPGLHRRMPSSSNCHDLWSDDSEIQEGCCTVSAFANNWAIVFSIMSLLAFFEINVYHFWYFQM